MQGIKREIRVLNGKSRSGIKWRRSALQWKPTLSKLKGALTKDSIIPVDSGEMRQMNSDR
jgi:hypothetical protein